MLSEQSGSKKKKADTVSGTRSAEPGPSVIISDELANFLGVSVREMLQSEIVYRIWEYIKVNSLEVGKCVNGYSDRTLTLRDVSFEV